MVLGTWRVRFAHASGWCLLVLGRFVEGGTVTRGWSVLVFGRLVEDGPVTCRGRRRPLSSVLVTASDEDSVVAGRDVVTVVEAVVGDWVVAVGFGVVGDSVVAVGVGCDGGASLVEGKSFLKPPLLTRKPSGGESSISLLSMSALSITSLTGFDNRVRKG
uniref:Hypothetical secreted protein 910 n=1 Tax=Amblyomma variegatum TaxID=34610 RepID=F0JA98_AMBVA|nr:TPA_inf: hypothetical secreted protein 910 [Amblyomma variegatum]